MRKDSLAATALAALLLLPGCAWISKSSSSASSGMTPDQAAAMLSGLGSTPHNSQRSLWQKMTSPVTESAVVQQVSGGLQQGAGKIGSLLALQPQRKPAVDPLSLARKPDPSDPKLQTSLAVIAENGGRPQQAIEHLEKALAQDPHHLPALLAYGHLLDRQGRLTEALDKYRRAVQHHPRSPQALNDLGLCLARQGQLREALQPLERAVALQPRKALYRNNTATVLAELGRADQALAHLQAVHPLPVAHYNLGTLLHRRGALPEAAHHFAQAAALDPSFTAARQLASRLSGQLHPSIPASYTPVGLPATRGPAHGSTPVAGTR